MAWKRQLFDPQSKERFKVSRSKIDLFCECPRCAYLDLRLGVSRVQGPSFTLNTAVDTLLKTEFDTHRGARSRHPFLEEYGVDAVPFSHPDMDSWRENFVGIQYHHVPTNFLVTGAIDDVWVNPKGELIIVDYKATSKKEGPSTTEDLYDSYKRQMEIYQWLFRQSGFPVHDVGYFVYVNGRSDAKAFDKKLEFDVVLIPYKGNSQWIEKKLKDLKETLLSEKIPPVGKGFRGGPCDYCTYRESAGKALLAQHAVTKKPVQVKRSKTSSSTTDSMF